MIASRINKLSFLSNRDLSMLEQEILAEPPLVMNSSTAIAVESDAPEESHFTVYLN